MVVANTHDGNTPDGSTADVLMFGHDEHLSVTRSLVLKRSGYLPVSVETEEAFQSAVMRLRPRLILLCQTLEAQECHRSEEFAEQHCPDIRVIIMFNQRWKCLPAENGALVRSAAGPQYLLRTVEHLIGRPPAHPIPACTVRQH